MPWAPDVHIDQALTTLSISYKNPDLIYERVMPSIPVDKRSDLYFIYGREQFRKLDDLVRPGSVSPEWERTISRDSYNAERHAQKQLITDAERRLSDNPLQPDADTTEFLTDRVMNQREFNTISLVTDPTQVPNNLTLSGTSQWSDYVNSAPLSNIKNGRLIARFGALREANVFTMSLDVGLGLADHPSIKDLIKYTSPGNISSAGLPNVIRGLQVAIAGAYIDTSNPGQTPSMAAAWGKNALIHYTNPAPGGLKTITFGATFEAPDDTTGVRGFSMLKWRDENRHGDYVECATTYALKLIAPTAAYLFLAAVA